MGALKLLRTELACLSLTLPKTMFRAPSHRRLWVVLSPEPPKPPSEPPNLSASFSPMSPYPPFTPNLLLRPSPLARSLDPPPDSPKDEHVPFWSAVAMCILIRHTAGPDARSPFPFLHSIAPPPPPCLSETLVRAWPTLSFLGSRFSIFIGPCP